MILLTNPLLFKILPSPPRAMALFPFVLVEEVDDKYDKVLINHEKIHLRQQLEMLIVPFYLAYLGHYIVQLIRFKEHHKAYMNIVFEREAYQNESDLEYLRKRKIWGFWKYWSK
ncbi:hypothetical protein [Bernardetia sp.]|uniref:hypothetical protein n=1 Tax=Bernardetia sp. TaxID=1937974 RepID=UPI0025C16607|nr:hypothetical protein [Bernardetia sp.]